MEAYKRDTGAKSAKPKFLVSSPKQLKWIYRTNGIKIDQTNEETLHKVLNKLKHLQTIKPNKEVDTFVKFTTAVLELRKLEKQHKTYEVGLSKTISNKERIHSSFNVHGTETGRLSSSNPNIHNIPRDKSIKNIFRASPGNVLIQLDYSQAELRVLAVLSADPWLMQVYLDDKDLHSAVAAEMYGPTFTKEQRNLAKTINFGIAYGRGPQSIADAFSISKAEAQATINKWFEPMPVLKKYITNCRAKPLKGVKSTTPLGRERTFVVTNKNRWHVQNEAINFPIQSVASDMTLFSLIEIHKWLQERIPTAYIVNTVHDSIIVEAPNNPAVIHRIVHKAKEIMEDIPKQYLNSPIPFKADAEVGNRWGMLKDYVN